MQDTHPTSSSRRLRTEGAAEYVGSTKSTMEKKRVSGDGPPFIKVGRVVVYDTGDLDTWLAAQRRRSTSDRTQEANAP